MTKIVKSAKAGQKKHALIGVKPGLTGRRDGDYMPRTRAEKGLHRLSIQMRKHMALCEARHLRHEELIRKNEKMILQFAGELGKLTTMIYVAGIKHAEKPTETTGIREELPLGQFVEECQHRTKCPNCGR
jgi:hypothetical protein